MHILYSKYFIIFRISMLYRRIIFNTPYANLVYASPKYYAVISSKMFSLMVMDSPCCNAIQKLMLTSLNGRTY